MRITTLNVNGIRSACAKGLAPWLEAHQADVICLQEVRASEDHIPLLLPGHHTYWHLAARPGYSGVGLLSRKKPKRIVYGMGNPLYDAEGRVLRADFADYSMISVYVPSGASSPERQAFKMQFLPAFLQHVAALAREGRELIICGDINIAHKPIDLKNWRSNQKNSGFLPEERAWMDELLGSGFVDTFRQLVGPQAAYYSWWSNRGRARENDVGWRLDYHLTTPGIAHAAHSPAIHKEPFFSDHAPVTIDYRIG
ncbi:MAG TPA: exodeoxyribonuclease III [Meiothermus sp.]|jgi:exodeoxyribonuclease-3|nr:exodeoxyribonuclease III [Meiothermus sp.]